MVYIIIFNSNLFGLDLFDMGLSQKFIFSFGIKRVYSIVFQTWYIIMIGPKLVTIMSMIFSLISITITIIISCTQKRIYFTQDYVYISFDITGGGIMNNMRICKNRIKPIKTYLSQQILGVNERSVDIQRPYVDDVVNGLQMQIHIRYIHDKSKNVDH